MDHSSRQTNQRKAESLVATAASERAIAYGGSGVRVAPDSKIDGIAAGPVRHDTSPAVLRSMITNDMNALPAGQLRHLTKILGHRLAQPGKGFLRQGQLAPF